LRRAYNAKNYSKISYLFLCVILLTACGGGGNGTNLENKIECTETFAHGPCAVRVNTVAGPNGNIEPATALLGSGSGFHFSVAPDLEYVAEVSATCGSGDQSGDTYSVRIWKDCTVAANFIRTFNVSTLLAHMAALVLLVKRLSRVMPLVSL
jgi:hypothetical protein